MGKSHNTMAFVLTWMNAMKLMKDAAASRALIIHRARGSALPREEARSSSHPYAPAAQSLLIPELSERYQYLQQSEKSSIPHEIARDT
jgi:hypothetical protein